MKTSVLELVREYGPFPEVECVHGVTYDGRAVWFATGDRINALDPESGQIQRALSVTAYAGTAFDGRHLFQLAAGRIQKIDPKSGRVVTTVPAPTQDDNAGLAWGEGSLWVGQHEGRKIHQIDPESGAILRTIESNRHVTGVTWAGDELWHGTWEDNDESELRRVDPRSGQVLERHLMPPGTAVSGLEAGGDVFFCGGGRSGKVRVVRRPRKGM
ncbi:MAG TPA: hypothetical protein VFE31_08450 [Opitutaceae bacterium]|jgi:glutamine cyclotransferase|nr:hypothetical protein [Opitutaceae bacterium]